LLGLQVEIREDRDLDGAGLGEDFVLVQKEMIAGGQVFERHSQHTIEVLVDLLNFSLKFLPENFLFSSRRRRRLREACGQK